MDNSVTVCEVVELITVDSEVVVAVVVVNPVDVGDAMVSTAGVLVVVAAAVVVDLPPVVCVVGKAT
eukprot:CAMPEP_0113686996 /NCGR_PEP_ID=MMETSP0038_2-20120614/15641_1 /TAXON_ID=2898 /ORGANISM="Cryptomonas paramecium" /LENGTH=65 /DNA_ID=CAMNT_0000607463 /DNA_START=212 /DNA_END=405 /DNA_ORIENTATION=- /assembly_acc=CAM_ASM_000170